MQRKQGRTSYMNFVNMFPRIEVILKDGRYHSLDNRRLLLFKKMGNFCDTNHYNDKQLVRCDLIEEWEFSKLKKKKYNHSDSQMKSISTVLF